ncbi:tetrahydrofolate synthase [Segatella salivae]|uniref:tetrahydrofolate synthase n=1 Tax=Segatella salivae TaxID=228604 RepID=UPI0028ECD093|nr:tetrahydrofolate synthase [Segatella salivae]
MDVFAIVNVTTTQRRGNYANIPMNVYFVMIALMVQLGTSCTFDSPGLARNEPTPGEYSQGDSTPSVLSFFYEGMVIARRFIADCA